MLAQNIFPFAHIRVGKTYELLDEQFDIDYALPPLQAVTLNVTAKMADHVPPGIRHGLNLGQRFLDPVFSQVSKPRVHRRTHRHDRDCLGHAHEYYLVEVTPGPEQRLGNNLTHPGDSRGENHLMPDHTPL